MKLKRNFHTIPFIYHVTPRVIGIGGDRGCSVESKITYFSLLLYVPKVIKVNVLSLDQTQMNACVYIFMKNKQVATMKHKEKLADNDLDELTLALGQSPVLL